MIKNNYSTIGPICLVLAQQLEKEGIDPEPLFKNEGFSLESLRDPSVRVPAKSFNNIMREIGQQSNNPVFGLSLSDYIHPTTFYSLGIAMYCSDTLNEYLELMVKYYRMLTTNHRLSTHISNGIFHLQAENKYPLNFPPMREDSIAAFFVRVIGVALQKKFVPNKVYLARPTPTGNEHLYQQHFGCEVIFDAEFTGFDIDEQLLKEPLPSANQQLKTMYNQLTVEYLNKLDRADFVTRVQEQLIKLLPLGNSGKEEVAQALNISSRSLYNKLETAGTSYREVLDETRQDLAESYLKQNLPVYEVAYLIGFSDVANFSRAFKKWTGMPAAKFKEQCHSS